MANSFIAPAEHFFRCWQVKWWKDMFFQWNLLRIALVETTSKQLHLQLRSRIAWQPCSQYRKDCKPKSKVHILSACATLPSDAHYRFSHGRSSSSMANEKSIPWPHWKGNCEDNVLIMVRMTTLKPMTNHDLPSTLAKKNFDCLSQLRWMSICFWIVREVAGLG